MKSWAHLTPKLDILNKKDGTPEVDDVIKAQTDNLDTKTDYSRKIIAALPLSSRLHRDLAIDYMNPQEELAKYIQTEDTIPAYDMTTLSLLVPEDGAAKQEVGLYKQSIVNWAKEENKYNPQAPDIPGKDVSDPYAYSGAKWNKILQQNLLWQHQTAIDQISSL